MIRKVIYTITIINILFQVIYMSLGKYTMSEIGILKYVFYVFRTEYMVVSGLIAFIILCAILVLIIKSIKKIHFLDIIMLVLNIEYIIYYIRFLMKQ